MKDAKGVAREIVTLGCNGRSHDHRIGCASLEYLIAAAVTAAAAAALERAAKEVPTSWLDPLLSGPDAAIPAGVPWTNRHIEALLRGIQDRIRALAAAPPEPAGG